jgi:hypothetical protein
MPLWKSEQEREFRNKTPKNEGQHALNSRLPLVVGKSQHHQTTEDDVPSTGLVWIMLPI